MKHTQFAVSPLTRAIVFGLAYGTVLILLFVPAMITIIENGKAKLGLKPTEYEGAATSEV